MPWRNGGGTTREVAADRRGADGAFRWRISVAQVAEDGPFSIFPGIDRTIWLLRGAGMVLDVEGHEHRLDARLVPFAFDGAARVTARLIDGPTEDLNLMVERTTTVATSRILRVAPGSVLPVRADPTDTLALLLLAGRVEVAGPEVTQHLTEGDALLARGAVEVELAAREGAETVLLQCRLAPRSAGRP